LSADFAIIPGARMQSVKQRVKSWIESSRLPEPARFERKCDYEGLDQADPGPQKAIELGLAWLCEAQDHSKSCDGGVARHYDLIDGWSASYPETTGYIAETFLQVGLEPGRQAFVDRGRKMLDWLVSIQFPDGGFQGGVIDQLPRVQVTFNTGQILTGLCEGTRLDSTYREPMTRAADWLANSQDEDGCWRKWPTPFAAPGEKAYETHVALALFRAAKLEPGKGYAEAARRQVGWALRHQRPNGWFDKCCLSRPDAPLTHTLGYALRGLVEAYWFTREAELLEACLRTADGILAAIGLDGRLPGRLDQDWRGVVPWVCLTGSAQIAECLFLLSQMTKTTKYIEKARSANAYVRRTIKMNGSSAVRGGVKGSFPVDGDYGRWQYLNWACKFMIDANRAELQAARDIATAAA